MENVNNHIHTTYSFSPYTPTDAAFKAKNAGLSSAGIMDHDSVGGAFEFVEASKRANIASTVGFECRVDMKNTELGNKRFNNPDQMGIAYVAMHGIPHQNIEKAEAFLAPYRQARNVRNRKMTDRINALLKDYGVSLDFEKDIVSISMSDKGGVITERHILFALACKLISKYNSGEQLLNFLENDMKIKLSEKVKGFLNDENNAYRAYDLLGVLKGSLIEKIYIDATDECPDVKEFVALSKELGAIAAYAYLGDVGESVTGDKKAQTFEDSYLDELFVLLKSLGFNAVTYMPTRNTLEQLERVMQLCEKHQMFQISGEDINSPRQSFICEALGRKEFQHLITSTWALIGHEQEATKNIEDAMFSEKTVKLYPNLKDRIEYFAKLSRGCLE